MRGESHVVGTLEKDHITAPRRGNEEERFHLGPQVARSEKCGASWLAALGVGERMRQPGRFYRARSRRGSSEGAGGTFKVEGPPARLGQNSHL